MNPNPTPAPVRIADAILDKVRSGALKDWPAERILDWGLQTFAPRIALSASFGSREGMVLLDMMHKIDPVTARVFTIDTGRLPQQTHDLMDRVRDRYDTEVELYFPRSVSVEPLVREHGANLFFDSIQKRRLCCAVRKVEPLQRALADLDAWISGLRHGQSVTRSDPRVAEVDEVHGGRIKLNPLARWSRQDIESYVRENAVPVNALHRQGYPSVGCAPCSRPVQPDEDERAGRWWWESPEHRECGIHVGYEEGGSGI